MIIECPKCKTKFEVADSAFVNGEMKFQCSECAFIWNERIEKAKKLESSDKVEEKDDNLPSILTEEEEKIPSKRTLPFATLFNSKNLLVFFMAVVLFVIIFAIGGLIMDSSSSKEGAHVFENVDKKEKANDLYVEIVKPLTLTKEGTNEYIIIRGFVYNPTNKKMSVPKLVIRLENRDERVLQEQEREIEKKVLAPLEKTDFMFKVFKFSSQVARVKVDFVDENKI